MVSQHEPTPGDRPEHVPDEGRTVRANRDELGQARILRAITDPVLRRLPTCRGRYTPRRSLLRSLHGESERGPTTAGATIPNQRVHGQLPLSPGESLVERTDSTADSGEKQRHGSVAERGCAILRRGALRNARRCGGGKPGQQRLVSNHRRKRFAHHFTHRIHAARTTRDPSVGSERRRRPRDRGEGSQRRNVHHRRETDRLGRWVLALRVCRLQPQLESGGANFLDSYRSHERRAQHWVSRRPLPQRRTVQYVGLGPGRWQRCDDVDDADLRRQPQRQRAAVGNALQLSV